MNPENDNPEPIRITLTIECPDGVLRYQSKCLPEAWNDDYWINHNLPIGGQMIFLKSSREIMARRLAANAKNHL